MNSLRRHLLSIAIMIGLLVNDQLAGLNTTDVALPQVLILRCQTRFLGSG
jgi:hypothetical protein